MSVVKQAVEQYVLGLKPKAWSHDRGKTVGASEVGQCARKIWFLKNQDKVERDDGYIDSWGAKLRGNLLEEHLLVPAIAAKYPTTIGLGEDQQTLVDGPISATPDCYIEDPSGTPFLIEFKSIDPRSKLEQAKQEHVYQVQVQMGILWATTKRRPRYAIIAYVNASFIDEITEFRIDYDAEIYTRAKARAAKILVASSLHELSPEGWIAGGNECRYCAFTTACDRGRTEVPENGRLDAALPDPQFVAEIVETAVALKALEDRSKDHEVRKRQLQTDIKDRLREKGLRRVVGNGVSVGWSPVKGRETYDMVGLQQAAFLAGVDIEQFRGPGVPGDRLTVTVSNPPSASASLRRDESLRSGATRGAT
jgi:hypothetical protein